MISAGVPINYSMYRFDEPSLLDSNIFSLQKYTGTSTSYLSSAENDDKILDIGFKENLQSYNYLSSMSKVKELFTNEFTQINVSIPKVRALNKEDVDLVCEKTNTQAATNDLIRIPTQSKANPDWCASYWLATEEAGEMWYVGDNGNMSYDEEAIRGVRFVVSLKSNVKFSESSGKTNNYTTWDISI